MYPMGDKHVIAYRFVTIIHGLFKSRIVLFADVVEFENSIAHTILNSSFLILHSNDIHKVALYLIEKPLNTNVNMMVMKRGWITNHSGSRMVCL